MVKDATDGSVWVGRFWWRAACLHIGVKVCMAVPVCVGVYEDHQGEGGREGGREGRRDRVMKEGERPEGEREHTFEYSTSHYSTVCKQDTSHPPYPPPPSLPSSLPSPSLSSPSPLPSEALPEGHGSLHTDGHHPGVGQALGLAPHTHICIQSIAQQETAKEDGVVLHILGGGRRGGRREREEE